MILRRSSRDPEKTREAKAAAARAAATAREKALNTVKLSRRKRLQGFVEFFREQGVVGLAIGLVLGTQVKVVVDQFLASFVNPILGLILPGTGDLSQKKFALTVPALDKTAVFHWGAFAYVMLSFLIVLMIIYYVFKGLRLDKLNKKK